MKYFMMINLVALARMAAALCMKAHDNRCSAGALILSTVHEGEEDVMVVMAQEEEEEEEVVVVVEEEEACSLGGDMRRPSQPHVEFHF